MSDSIAGMDRAHEIDAAWRAAAEELEGEYGIAPTVHLPWLQARWEGGRITVVLERVGDAVHTRLRAPFVDPGGVTLAVRGEGRMSRLLERLGAGRDVEVGDPAFDARFRIRGHPEDRVRGLLAPPVPGLLLDDPDRVLEVSGTSDDVSYPDGVSELVLESADVVDRTERLTAWVRLAGILLRRLDPAVLDGPSGRERWAARLTRPGGRGIDPWRDLVLWDGDAQRREAALKLGETGDPASLPPLVAALDDADPALVLAAVAGLEALGESAPIPDLVARLGRRGPSVDGVTIPAGIAGALRSLGRGPFVDAFEKALAGDPDDLVAEAREADELRDAVVTALLEILRSYDLDDRVPAATALGALGARRALPLLRKKASGPEAPTELTEACRTAAERIEASH